MALTLDLINQVCLDLGGTGGHKMNIDALNEVCTLLGGTGGHAMNIDALNEIQGSVTYKQEIDALNAIITDKGGTAGTHKTSYDAWQAIQQGSKLNLLPFYSDALFVLDGTILDVAGTKYFVDKKNAKNFLITGYDFATGWAKGFPYKSSATISAPAADAALIAADVNGFLYTAGTPNQIPVISLFQDVDYEHKLFCKHGVQVLDVNGVETYEPRVLDVVLYTTTKAGADLTKCQTYYEVPVEDATAKWVAPASATPAGNDANAGTKAAPDLTVQASLAAENTGKRIYFKTQYPQLAETVVISGNNHDLYAVGLVKVTGYNINYYLQFTNANQEEFIGFIYECKDEQGRRFSFEGTYNLKFNRNYIKGRGTSTGGYNMNAGNFKEALNNVFTGRFSQSGAGLLCSQTTNDILISGNYFNQIEGTYDIYVDAPTTKNITIIHNKHVGAQRVGGGPLNISLSNTSSGSVLIKDNYIKPGGAGSININARGNRITNDYQLEICYNTIIRNFAFYKAIELLEHQIYIPHIHHNYIETNVANERNSAISYHTGNCWVEYNIIISTLNGSTGDDIDSDIVTGELIATGLTHKVNNNKVISNRTEQTHIKSGGAGVDAIDKVDVDIYNNVVKGYGTFNAGYGNAIGIVAYYQKNSSFRYNWVDGCNTGIMMDCTSAFTSEGIYSNVVKNCFIGIAANGLGCEVNIFNNTIVSNQIAATGIKSTNSAKIIAKNNIVILLGTGNCYGANIINATSVVDYNIYYCPNGTLLFSAPGQANKTFAQWQALGYDAHSIVLTSGQYAALFTDAANDDYSLPAGSAAIGAGVALDAAYDDGLDVSTNWGSDTETPTVVTKQQGASWDIGAYVN